MLKRSLLCAIGICLWWVALAQVPAPSPRYSFVRVMLGTRNLADLAQLGIETDHGEGLPGQFFQTELSEQELKSVQDAGFQTLVLVPDVVAQYQADLQARLHIQHRSQACVGVSPYATPKNYTPGSIGGYHTYAEMLAVLDDMAAKYPHLLKARAPISDTLLTHENRHIWYVKISDNPQLDEAEPQVLYTALHHAREPNSMSQMLFFMWYLLENYDTHPEIKYLLDNEEIYFVPCVNPDGYLFNESTHPQGGGLWRKNRRKNANGTYGVDLNRNYGYRWAYTDQGSSPDPGSEVYRGPAAFSEPETRMMRDFCQARQLVFAHNYHTKGNLLIYPWAYNAQVADTAFIRYARLFTRENHYKTGITFETVGYAVNGSAEDWMHASEGTFAMTPEVGRGPFWPMPEFIDPYNKANVWQNLSTALCALRFGLVEDVSANYWSQQQLDLPMRFTRYGLQEGAFQISLLPLSNNVTVQTSPLMADVKQFGTKNLLFKATLSPTIQVGEEFVLLVKTQSGDFIRTDTLRKYYGGKIQTAFTEDGASLSEWTGTWKTTITTYVSPPSCITDSPNGNYGNNQSNEFYLRDMHINLPPSARQPFLRFWAKWDLEDNRDYVAIWAESSTGDTMALCGRYTNTAASAQGGGDFPLYDGLQPTWVEECLDLSDFIGKSFSLRFRLGSGNQNNLDGFYFDDLRVEYTDPKAVQVVTVPLQDFHLNTSEPNPAQTFTTITWQNPQSLSDAAELVVLNALGQPVWTQTIHLDNSAQVRLDVRTWPSGTYSYFIRTQRWQTPARTLAVVR